MLSAQRTLHQPSGRKGALPALAVLLSPPTVTSYCDHTDHGHAHSLSSSSTHLLAHLLTHSPRQFFFRGGPRSASWCLATLTLFVLLLAAYFAWSALWSLGYLPALGVVGVVEMLLPGSHMVSVDYR